MFDPNAYTLTMLLAVAILAFSFWLSRAGHYTANLIAIIVYWTVLLTSLFAFQTEQMRGLDYLWGENKLIAFSFVAVLFYLFHNILTMRKTRGNN